MHTRCARLLSRPRAVVRRPAKRQNRHRRWRGLIIGDSLTVLAWRDLYDRLDPRYAVRIGAGVGECFNPGKLSTGLGMKPILPHVASLYTARRDVEIVRAIDACAHRRGPG